MLRAAFIGIDKHRDLRIRDLIGARRDATALWALFCDTLPDIEARLVVDADATTEGMRRALDETLGTAGSDDTVILSFAGHGTPDHRVVTHDTVKDNLVDTTISMEELATRFKKARAKAVLFILDCCFSGGAPARVLEDVPIPRNTGTTLTELAGKGRILIAASNVDESAWEHPTTRHGLLTKALIDVLQTAEDPVSLPAAIDQVMERVRIDANRLGAVQTPVLFGFVEGGLTLPALRPGKNFYAAFPDVRGVRVGHDVMELATFGLPPEVLTAWTKQFSNGLNDLQLQAVNAHRILDGESLMVVAPTSSGKTFIGEMAAVRAIVDGRKAVFLLPYRALVNEKYDQFSELYGQHLDMRVIRCTGDYADHIGAFVRGKYDLALLTYEMFLNLVVGNPALLSQLGLVVLDEAQFITDPHRGIAVELLLTYLLTARDKAIAPQLIALSAVIGGVNDFDTWLGCNKLVTHDRPVPLTEGVLDRSGVLQLLEPAGSVQHVQFLPPEAVQVRRDKPSAQDMIVPLVRTLVQQGEKIIVFRNQRGAAEGCAAYLSRELGLPPAAEALQALLDHDLSTTSVALRSCLNGGTAFHNTNLTREERAVIEQAFRTSDSKVHVLAATTTVAAGINTPASTVILAEQEFVGEDGRPFTVAEYKNMAGRAGRLGFKEEGKAIILADNSYERERLFARYVMGQLEEFRSSFDLKDIATWVVRLLAQIERMPRKDIVRLLANTYGGYLASKKHPEWHSDMVQRLEELLERMITLDLVEQEEGWIQLTLLGRACGRSALSFESALRLVELLRGIQMHDLTAEKLMVILQVLPESDNGYTPMMRRGRREASHPSTAAQRYGQDIIRLLQRRAKDEFDYFARCKRAAILGDWIDGKPIEEIEQRYSTNPYQGTIGHGDVRKFADATRFHLRSAHQIASFIFIEGGLTEESIDVLLRQLEIGIPADALALVALPLPLARGEYLALYRRGIKTKEEFWTLSRDTVKEILGQSRAFQFETLRPAP